MSKSEKLFVILEIINVFRILALPEIAEIVGTIFSQPAPKELRYLLSILVTAGYVTRKGSDEEYFASTDPPHTFFEYEGAEIDTIKIALLDYYQSTDVRRFTILEN